MIDLAGKVAVVTGSAAGIGAATVKRFASLGASVVVADLNGVGAQKIAEEITAEGGSAVSCRTDVRDEEQVHAMVMAAVQAFGGLDVLHNNAANMSAEIIGNDRDVETMTVARWDETHAVALRGAMLGCKHAVPLMRQRGGGSIINTASTSGQTGMKSMRVPSRRSIHQSPRSHRYGRAPLGFGLTRYPYGLTLVRRPIPQG
jgi:NAD(P)-dependent dehydrogenase (short-subunit alcohol dehydrogenase family)